VTATPPSPAADEFADLAELNPYDALDREAERLQRFFASLPEERWGDPSRCEDWTVRDVLAHLASTESYHHACLDDTLSEFLERGLDAGAADVATFNELGIRSYDGRPPAEILAEWRDANAETRTRMRERDGGTMTTMVPNYPVRRQAFHVASELATHADDVGVPVEPDEAAARTEWRARFSRFALAEESRPVEVIAADGRNWVRAGDAQADLSDAELVEAVAGRLQEHPALPESLRQALSMAV
jgi:uncharacterized protein (TIGR03083 family)